MTSNYLWFQLIQLHFLGRSKSTLYFTLARLVSRRETILLFVSSVLTFIVGQSSSNFPYLSLQSNSSSPSICCSHNPLNNSHWTLNMLSQGHIHEYDSIVVYIVATVPEKCFSSPPPDHVTQPAAPHLITGYRGVNIIGRQW